MILSQVSYLDCLVFVVFLAPQLLLHVGLWSTLVVGLKALPFLLLKLPFQFVRERFLTSKSSRSPFVQQATIFQDLVIRCVRYAFAEIPASVGRVFFSKGVSLPFMLFRLFRHGYTKFPFYWREVDKDGVHGVWVIADELDDPDVVVFYCHGGGFSMGSSYFYLEFLMAWATLLQVRGFRNPAVFALEYSLVPDAIYPTQLHQTIAGYRYVLAKVQSASQVCVAGDSAGGTLVLSLLLHLAHYPDSPRLRPGFATLISPWVTLVSDKIQNNTSDYLNAESLQLYARQYAGSKVSLDDPLVSPGTCTDLNWWREAVPFKGMHIIYGAEEVFAPCIQHFISQLEASKVSSLSVREEPRSIHAWPVATLFLSDTKAERQKGLAEITNVMGERLLKA